jgi:hypothetical protein
LWIDVTRRDPRRGEAMEPDVNPLADRTEVAYAPAPVFREEHAESRLTRLVEQQTAKIPSHVFLLLALGAMAASAIAEARHEHRASQFVGMWPAPLLVMGLYNKLVKTLLPR